MEKFKIVILIILVFSSEVFAQQKGKAKIAVIQANKTQIQDPFMEGFDPAKVRPQMMSHVNKLLDLFDEAGKSGADLVCGPEDMQQIGAYGLHINVNDPETGKILFNSLAVPVPGPLTDKIAEIARRHNMYIIAPIYEDDGDLVYNTSVFFDRQGNILGKHRKTLMPIMETWLVSAGDEYPVFETDFANVAIATCWEISYPEITSIYALKGADIVFNPTMAKDNKPGQSLETAHMFITRARDNSVYIAPVVLGKDGNGIIDFNGNVVAEAVGKENAVVMAEIDFSKERVNKSEWWESINGTNKVRAMYLKSRRPDIYELLSDPNPPLLERYKDVHLTTGDRERQLKAVREVDYGPKKYAGNNKNLYQDLPKIDAHLHIRTEKPGIIHAAMEENFRFLTICTRANSQEYIDEQRTIAKNVHDKFPQTLAYVTTFSMENFEQPSWQEKVIEQLKQDFEEGAVGVKVWKDIGMTFRDSLGNFIMIDDPRFDPVLDFIAENGKTLVAHIGEPRNCWLPLDSMTVNNDRIYFEEHPQYHMYLHPDYPSYETLITARDNMLTKHPNLRVVGAHLGSLEWSVDELAERLDRFPGFAVDMSARICHFQVQDHAKVRDFILKYQDRLLYATDIGISDQSNMEETIERFRTEWETDWTYFSTGNEMESPHVNGSFHGLDLDENVLRKIYTENAVKWYPGCF
jgi:predicted amidohydrolase/predicted TIM-barrel fold metal-dependent hydrolase